MLEILGPLRLNVLLFPEVFNMDHARELLGHAMKRPEAARYDVLVDYSRVTTFDIAPGDLVQMALKRRAALPEAPSRALKSAIVGARPEIWQILETWIAFFGGEHRAVDPQPFDTVEAALDWLGHGDALDQVRAVLSDLSARQ